MYGLTNLGVIKYIQVMPNAYRCRQYKPLTWILDGQGDHDTSELSDQSLNKISTTSMADMSLSSPSSSSSGQSPRRRKQRTNSNSIYASNLMTSGGEYAIVSSDTNSPLSITTYLPRKYVKKPTRRPPSRLSTPPLTDIMKL